MVVTQSLPVRRAALAGACLSLLLAAAPGRADLLPFDLSPGGPVVLSFNLNFNGLKDALTYDAATGKFHTEMAPLVYTTPGGTMASFTGPGSLVLDLTVGPGGALAGGTFQLSGTVDLGGAVFSGDLLDGTVTAFGADPAGPPSWAFNALFTIEGGALTADPTLTGFASGSPGEFIGFAENVTTGTLGDFTQNFASSSVKSDVGVPIPEPASLALALVGAAVATGVGAWRQRRARCQAGRGPGRS
jgi:hypothetical protein